MVKKVFIALLFIFCGIMLFGDGDYVDPFIVYVYSEGLSGYYDSAAGLFGYINKKGDVAIEPQFSMVGKFKDGLALIQTESYQFAFINQKGKIVIGPSETMYTDFSDGLAYTWNSDEINYIDKTGKIALKVKYSDARLFHDGLAAVMQLDKDGNGKWGYIDKKGKIVIKPQFVEAGDFPDGPKGDGLAKIGVPDDKNIYGFSYGYIDKTGKIVIKPKFLSASDFSEGVAYGFDAQKERIYGYFDKTGKWVIQPQFEGGVGDFHDGLAPAGIFEKGEQSMKMGYIDKKGKFVIKAEYSSANRFSEGLAAVLKDGKVGFIDSKGKFVIEPKYDAMFAGYEDY
jgi:hypothetical protein